jgi:hypothetical protein
MTEASNRTTIFNNELLYELGLRENEANPAQAERLQGMNKSFLDSPWVAVPDFADRTGQPRRGVIMTRATPRQAMGMAWGDRGLADRLMDRNVVGQEAPFPIIRSDGGHLDAPIFAFQSTKNDFPDHEALGLFHPWERYALWNSNQALGDVPVHEFLGHGLMDGGISGRKSQGVEIHPGGRRTPIAFESDFNSGELPGRLDRRMDRVHRRYLENDPLNEAAEWDAENLEAFIRRMAGDPAEMRALMFTLKQDAKDVMKRYPITPHENDRFLRDLIDDYVPYGDEQPIFQTGPREGEYAPDFNEKQRALKTYFQSLTPEDRKIFRQLWFKFGQNGGADGQAGQPLVV